MMHPKEAILFTVLLTKEQYDELGRHIPEKALQIPLTVDLGRMTRDEELAEVMGKGIGKAFHEALYKRARAAGELE